METTDFCSYKLSKTLKECGFAEPCDSYYIKDNAPDGTAWIVPTTDREDFNADSDCPFCKPLCSAPTLAQAQKWLREKKNICVTVYAQPYNGLPYYTGYILFEGDEKEVLDQDGHWFDDYEQCLSETIAAALELIKKGE